MRDEPDNENAPEYPMEAKPWRVMLDDAQAVEQPYHDAMDSIEELYANLKSMTGQANDRQFRLFWANMEVLQPTVYSRPPVPVVAPQFKDRRPVPRRAADLLERALQGMFEEYEIHQELQHVRDDFLLGSRGVAWLRLKTGPSGQYVCVEHLDRRDFLHEPARSWREVTWVAKRAFLTRKEMRARFEQDGNELPSNIEYKRHRLGRSEQGEGQSGEAEKAEVWEIWHRGENRVVWFTRGAQTLLDAREPYHDLASYWPCPRPCFGTLEPNTLKPVPEYYQYRDQLEELQELTARIHATSDQLRLQGFYAAGSSDIGEAVEYMMMDDDSRATLVPIKNMGGLSGQNMRDSIVWMPLQEVATALLNMIQIRQQIIQDIYEITGLSDIMRGESDASETATAQQLKAQFGNTRVKVRQQEMARFARDVIRLAGEMLAESFAVPDLMRFGQVDDLPAAQDVQVQAAQQAMQQAQQQGQQPAPEQIQQAVQQAMQETATVDAVQALLRDQKVRPFAIEVETDSTISIDENMEQEKRTRFLEAFGAYVERLAPLVRQVPEMSELAAETLRFVASSFRIDRRMDDAIDSFADQIGQAAQRGQQQPDAEQMKAQAEQQKMQIEAQRAQQEMQVKMAEAQADAQKAQADAQATMAETRLKQQQADEQTAKLVAEVEKLRAETEAIVSRAQADAQPIGGQDGNR